MEHVTNHDAQALARLAEQYKDKPKLAGLLSTLTLQVQAIEDAFWQLFTERLIPNAVGEQLDRIGVVVGLKRQALDDVTYRAHITATIALNRSSGTIPDLLAILGLLVPGAVLTVEEQFPAALVVRVSVTALTPADASLLNSFLERAKAAGVGAILEWFESPSVDAFRLDVGPGLDLGFLGGAL